MGVAKPLRLLTAVRNVLLLYSNGSDNRSVVAVIGSCGFRNNVLPGLSLALSFLRKNIRVVPDLELAPSLLVTKLINFGSPPALYCRFFLFRRSSF